MSVPNEGRISTRSEGFLQVITIDRPAKRNGFTPAMLRGYAQAITDFEADPQARCAVLHGEGPHTTAGLDLPAVSAAWDRGETVYPPELHDIWDLRPPLRRKPLVMAVRGITFTVGVELMLTADLVVAGSDCRFAVLEVTRGIMASGGATIRLPQRAGWGNAMRFLLTGDEFGAAEACRLGLVQEVVPPEEALERACTLARRVAEGAAPLAVQATRENARLAQEQGAEAARAAFDPTRNRLRATQDAREGLASFVERRPPGFTGR